MRVDGGRRNARRVALDVLLDISKGGAYAALSLDNRLNDSNLEARDKAMVTEMAMGTLERRIQLDYIINRFMTRPVKDAVLRDLLRLGAYQIMFLDRVPDSAACDESVKIAKSIAAIAPFASMVNAILRSVSREKENISYPGNDQPVLRLSVLYSYPEWIVERYIEQFGFEDAEKLLAYRERGAHHITIRPNRQKIDDKAFEDYMTRRKFSWRRGMVNGVYHVANCGNLAADPDFSKGLFTIQSDSAVLATRATGAKPGQQVLDVCAAPGGKSLLLAEMMRDSGRVFAWDIHEHRVELIRKSVARMGIDVIRPAVRDATVYKEDIEKTMDVVLIDAPCSGLGVVSGKPDVKYRVKPDDIPSLVEVGKKILDVCSNYVKPGGTLVYATCTVLKEENRDQIDRFLSEHEDFSPGGLSKFVPEAFSERIERGGGFDLQILPHIDHADGFYIARLTRKKA